MYEAECKHRKLSFELSFTFWPILYHSKIHHIILNFTCPIHFNSPPDKTKNAAVTITPWPILQVHNLFLDGNVVFFLFQSSCVLVLAHAQAVFQVQKEEALKLI